MPLLFVCIFIDLLGFGLMIPLLPFLALQHGGSPLDVTLLVATYSAALFIAGPFWGRVSDRIGRKPVLLISFIGTGSAFLLIAFADGLWMLFAARMIAGLLSGDIAAAPAYASDISKPENRAKYMGYLGVAFGLAFTIGPGITGYLVDGTATAEDYRNIPLLSAVLSGVTLLIALFFLPESKKPNGADAEEDLIAQKGLVRGFRETIRFPHMGLIIAIVFLVSFVFANMESTIAIWSKDTLEWGVREVGYLFVYAGVILIICNGILIGPLTKWMGEPNVLIGASLFLAIGMAVMSIADDIAVLLIGVAFLASGFAFCNPTLQSLVSRLCKTGTSGVALGVSQATSSLGRVTGPVLAGFLYENIGKEAPYGFGASLMVVVIALALLLMRRLVRGKHLQVDKA